MFIPGEYLRDLGDTSSEKLPAGFIEDYGSFGSASWSQQAGIS